MAENDDAPGLNPNALTLPNAARLLTRVGGHVITLEMLEAYVAAGAPVNANGTMNLVHFAAWLVKEMGSAD